MGVFDVDIDIGRLIKVMEQYKAGTKTAASAQDELDKAMKQVRREANALTKQQEELNKAQADFNEKNNLNKSLKEQEKIIQKMIDTISRLEDKIDDISTKTNGKSGGKSKNTFETEAEALEQLNLKFQDFAKDMDAQGKAWTMVNSKIDSSGREIKEYSNSAGSTVQIIKQLVGEEERFSATLKEVNNDLKKNANATNSSNAQYASREDVLKRLNVNLDEFKLISREEDSFGNVVERYTNNVGKMLTVTGKAIQGQTQFAGKIKEVAEQTDTSAKQADKWQYSWSKAFQSFTTYMSVSTIFYQIRNAIKEMIEVVIDLDESLVELKKVTDLEGDSLDKFIKKAYEAGEKVAKTGKEMVEAATAFAKAGYDSDLSLQLGSIAAMYTNIADEEIKVADAADMIIAQMKAFNMDATEETATRIIDVINEVSNNFAVSSADISKNLGKASAVMANAGNSYEQMIALMTAGTEVTRSADRVANGLKTITLRLQGMNDEGEKDLELVAQMEGLYRKLGLTVYNADGTLKNTYDLLGELAKVYSGLTAAEKAFVTETIAGKYQAQNAAAILGNWEDAVKSLETAQNSQGSAMRENEKVLDSIKGRINAFKSAFEKLGQSLVNSNLIKFVIDLGTAFLNLANSGIGQFIIKGTVAITAMYVLGKAFSALSLKVKGAAASFLIHKLTIAGVTEKNAKLIVSNYTTAESFEHVGKAALISAKTAGAAMLKFLVSPVGIAVASIAALTVAVTYHNQQLENHIKRMQEANEVYEESNNKWKDNLDNIKKYRDVLEDSSSTEEERNNAKKELLLIQNDLAQTFGQEANDLDLVNGKYKEQLNILTNLDKVKSKQWIASNYEDIEKAKKYLETGVHYGYSVPSSIKDYESSKYKPELEKFLKETMGEGTTKTRESWIRFYDEQIEKIEEMGAQWGLTKKQIEDVIGSITKSKNKILDDEQFKQSSEIYKNYIENEVKTSEKWADTYYAIKEQQDKYIEAKTKGDTEAANKALAELDKIQKGKAFKGENATLQAGDKDALAQWNYMVNLFNDYRDEISKYNFYKDYFNIDNMGRDSSYKKNTEKMIEEIKEELNKNKITSDDFFDLEGNPLEGFEKLAEEYGFSVQEFVDTLIDLGVVTEGVNHIVSSFADTTETWSKSVDNIQEKYQDLMGVMEEYNETGYITLDSLQKLLEKDWEYLQYLDFENGKLRLNTEALKAEASAKLDEAEATAYADAIQSIKLLKTQNEIEVNKHLKTSYENLKEKVDELHGSYADLISDEATLATIRGANGDEGVAAYENVKKELETKLQLINNVRTNLSKNFSSAMGYSSKTDKTQSSSSKNEKEWWEIELDNLKDQFKYNEITIEDYIGSLANLLGRVQQGTDAWRKINEELQKQRLTKVEDDYKRGVISLDEYIKKLKELIQAYKQGTDAWNNLADKIKSALQDKAKAQKDDYSTAEEAAIGLIDDEIDKLEKLKDEQEDYYDKLIDDKKKANDETERELELARLQEALANAQKEKTKRVWREGIGWVWEQDQKAIEDAQKALDEFQQEQEIEELEKQKDAAVQNIEDQIKAWEDYKKSWEDVADEYETQQKRQTLAQQLGADAEAKILEQRLDVLEKYKNGYLATMKEINDLENMTSQQIAGGSNPSSNIGSSAPASNTGRSYTVQRGDTLSGIGSKYGVSWQSIYDANKAIIGSNPNKIYPGQQLTIPGFSNGGVIDYTGLAMVHGTPNNPEFVLNNEQMKNLIKTYVLPQTKSNITGGQNAVTNYNFGNIELPNVSNAQQFVTELKSLVSLQRHQ